MNLDIALACVKDATRQLREAIERDAPLEDKRGFLAFLKRSVRAYREALDLELTRYNNEIQEMEKELGCVD